MAVLKNLNRAMRERGAGPFCTALYGTMQSGPTGGMFTFASGGHPLPIVSGADGSVASFGTHGTLIGAFDEVNVTTTTIALHPGDTVVLYTDGVTDVAPPHGLTTEAFTRLVGLAAVETDSAEPLALTAEAPSASHRRRRHTERRGITIELHNSTPQVARILEITGLGPHFGVE